MSGSVSGQERLRQLKGQLQTFAREKPLRATLLLVSVACLLSMLFLDRPLALWLKANTPSAPFAFFKAITDVGLGIVWFILFGGALFACWLASRMAHTSAGHQKWKARCEPWFYALAVQSLSGIVVHLLKFAFGRYRPKLLFNDQIYGFAPFSGNNSFPSGHSQAIWAAAVSLWFIAPPRWRPLWVLGALTISLSRVVTTVHFLSDVVMGATLSILLALWIKRMFDESDTRGCVHWE